MIQQLASGLLNLIFPKACISCRTFLRFDSEKHLCDLCWSKIQPIPEPFCQRCGVFLPDGGMRCYHCKKEKLYFSLIRCASAFTGPLRDLVHDFKYREKAYLSGELADLLIRTWRSSKELQETNFVVPVPLHPASLRGRGYNQAELLAQSFVDRLRDSGEGRLELGKKILTREKMTGTQTQFKRQARIANMQSAFGLVSDEIDLSQNKILLIDDVCTTGATLNECAKTLKKAGAKKVLGLTLARD